MLLATIALFTLNGCEQRGEVKPLWITQLPFHYLDTYDVADGVLVAFGADKEIYTETETLAGTLIGLDSKTGNKLWQTQIEADGRYLKQGSLPGGHFTVVAAGLVFVRDHVNTLHALDTHSGAEKWQANDVLSLLTISDGQVFVINGQKKLAALALSSGATQKVSELKWQHEIISCARMVVADGREYLAVDGVLTATNRTNGKQLWTTTLKTEGIEILAARGFLVMSTLSTFTILDGLSGKELWHFDCEGEAALPSIDGDIAYTGLEAAGEYHPDGGFTRGFKLATGEKVVEVKSGGTVADGVLYDSEWVEHYDFVSKAMVNGYQWRDSSDVRVVAKELKSGKKIWTADPWCWGWIEKRSVSDGVVYGAHVAVLASEPVRLLAYRATPPK
jgi:outer membrane protein assembly factor BamB